MGKQSTEQPEFLTAAEAMEVLRVRRSAFYRAVEAGDIPVVRIGRLIRVPRAALDELAHKREGSASPAA
jgi:excisionase family DNA binding protein